MSDTAHLYLVPSLIALAFLIVAGVYKSKIIKWVSITLLIISTFLCLGAFVLKSFIMPDVLGATFFLLKNGLGKVNFLAFKSLFLTQEFLLSIALMVGLIVAVYFTRNRLLKGEAFMLQVIGFTFIILSFICNPLLGALFVNIRTIRISEKHAAGDFADYYREPSALTKPESPPNLVLIYAESLEQKYFDESIFPGLLPNLKQFREQSVSFPNLKTMMHATIAGMLGSQCGLPLYTAAAPQNMDKFLPETTCMSDLMGEIGYNCVYMGGASLKFQSKGGFYTSHGFSEVIGKKALMKTLDDPKYKNHWGVHDDTLLNEAYKKFDTLAQQEQPFGLVLLTIDTHPPEGNVCRDCSGMKYEDGSNEYLNAIHCTDFLLARFLKQVRENPNGKDTLIVFMSDHLKNMQSKDPRCTTRLPDRRLTFFMNHPDLPKGQVINTSGTQLDIFPTIMSFFGGQDHMGLGFNLLTDEPTEVDRGFIYNRIAKAQWTKEILDMTYEKEKASLK